MYHTWAFKNLQNHLNQSIQVAKQNYVNEIAQKLGDSNTSRSATGHAWKHFKREKISLYFFSFHGIKYIADFHEKKKLSRRKIFNCFFADQCSPILNGTILPSELPLRTDNNLSSCYFTKVDILRIINNLDPNKAHGHDKITIPMLKMCVCVCVCVCVCGGVASVPDVQYSAMDVQSCAMTRHHDEPLIYQY